MRSNCDQSLSGETSNDLLVTDGEDHESYPEELIKPKARYFCHSGWVWSDLVRDYHY